MVYTDEIEQILKRELSKERYLHTLGVRDCAVELAKRYNLDVKKAELAGLLHDCAKCKTNDELKEIIDKFLDDVDKNELKNYKTLHAPVGAYYSKEKYPDVDINEIIKILNDNEGEKGLNLALLRCFIETVKSLAERRLYICKTTIDVYNWLLEITK